MTDKEIIERYWARDETALNQSAARYGAYCRAIACGILGDARDAEECVNDTWLRAWNAIPPHRPARLSLFFGKITRNLSLDRWKRDGAKKRGGGQCALLLEELDDCVPTVADTEQAADDAELVRSIGCFLQDLPPRECNIFLARYWYAKSLAEMAKLFCMKENAVKASLFRSRGKLRAHLEKEGVTL